MVSFRKMSMAFAGCLLLGVSAANASIPCTVITDQNNLRAEAITQPIGDITLSCTIDKDWVTPNPAAGSATFTVYSDGFQFTNRKDDDDVLAGVTIAVAGGAPAAGKAVLSSDGKSVTFEEIDIANLIVVNNDVDGGGDPIDATRTVVIHGLKMNASDLGLLSTPKVRLTAITYAAAIAKLVVSEATQDIGTVLNGVSFSFKNKYSVTCGGATAPDWEDFDDAARLARAYVTFTAGFPGGLVQTDELTARFKVPAGSKLFVATSAIDDDGAWNATVELGDADANEFVEVKANTEGIYQATWTIAAAPAEKTIRIPLYLVVPTNSPAASTLTATGSLGPWSDVLASTTDEDVDEPRYVEPTDYTDPIYEIGSCNTTLLFPYATNVGNWDTGIAITNPTADMKTADDKWASGSKTEKTGQTGACALYFIGENGTTKGVKTTKNLAAGKTLAFTVGQGSEEYGIAAVPGFNGYVKVSCDFSNGKGFAFMSSSDLGGVGVGYVAEGIGSLVP